MDERRYTLEEIRCAFLATLHVVPEHRWDEFADLLEGPDELDMPEDE